MANFRRRPGEINAGSMADIAFLLLIFFLVVSTMENDVGFNRKLPKWCPTNDCIVDINERNVLTIRLSSTDELMVNNEILPIEDLRQTVVDFVDNNGAQTCDYCHGKQSANASDDPKKAVVSILHSRQTSYEWFITIQNELVAAYFDLRKSYVLSNFNKSISELNSTQLIEVKEAYPFQISEAELQ